jgi:hypothetical protein
MHKNNPVREAVIFLSLTLALSYFVFWGPLVALKIPAASFVKDAAPTPLWALLLFMIGGFVPSLAGLALTGIYEGKAGLKRLGKRLIQFKLGWRNYLAAIIFILAITGLQLAIIQITGNKFNYSIFIAQLGSFLPLLIIGPLSEEIGWRGFALDRLQTRWNPLTSGLIVGIVWSLWHLPLFLMIGTSQHELKIPFIGFLLSVTSTSVLFTWLHNRAHSSIWMAVFFHWIYTYCAQVVASGITRTQTYTSLEYVPHIIVALVVILIWKAEFLKQPYFVVETTS